MTAAYPRFLFYFWLYIHNPTFLASKCKMGTDFSHETEEELQEYKDGVWEEPMSGSLEYSDNVIAIGSFHVIHFKQPIQQLSSQPLVPKNIFVHFF